jgi:hypothetical protein
MSDDVRSTRVRGEPNVEFLKKAKLKYKTYNREANTEFQRLHDKNLKELLTPNKNPNEHAIFHHLNTLRLQGDIR